MTCVVGKSKIFIEAALTCELSLYNHHVVVGIEPAHWESTFSASCKRTTSVVLETCAMGIDWQPNTTYKLVIDPGFTADESGDASIPQIIEITTNGIPEFVSMTPAQHDWSVVPFNEIRLKFDRYMNFRQGEYTIHLVEKNGSIDKLFYAEDVSFSDDHSTIILDVSDLTINESAIFQVGIDADALYDNDIFYYGGVDLGSTLSFATRITSHMYASAGMTTDATRVRIKYLSSHMYATVSMTDSTTGSTTGSNRIRTYSSDMQTEFSTMADPNVVLAADRWITTPSMAYYVEDTLYSIVGPSKIVDIVTDGSGSYTLTISASIVNSISNITTTLSGSATASYDASTATYTITGNKTDVNTSLDTLKILASPDYTSTITLNYKLYTDSIMRVNKSQSVILSTPYDSEVKYLNSFYQYYGKTGNAFFASSQTYISDFDTSPDLQYTITLAASQTGNNAGSGFASLDDGSDLAATWTYTGTKDQINTLFLSIKYYPGVNANGTTSFTYTQSKSDLPGVQLTATINCYFLSNVNTSSLYTYTSGTATWTPTFIEKRYRKMDYLVVGGGGSAMTGNIAWSGYNSLSHQTSAGAGGGDVIYQISQNISNTSYSMSVGAGGSPTLLGSTGGQTEFNGFVAYGGTAGYQPTGLTPSSEPSTGGGQTTTNHTGGSNTTYVGGNSIIGYDELSATTGYLTYGSAGGAGAGGNGGSASIITKSGSGTTLRQRTIGGNAGAGISSDITGTSKVYGAGGVGVGGDTNISGGFTPAYGTGGYTNYGCGGSGGIGNTTPPSGQTGAVIIKTHI